MPETKVMWGQGEHQVQEWRLMAAWLRPCPHGAPLKCPRPLQQGQEGLQGAGQGPHTHPPDRQAPHARPLLWLAPEAPPLGDSRKPTGTWAARVGREQEDHEGETTTERRDGTITITN